MYISEKKAVVGVRHLFYTSKIMLIVLELYHLIYIYIYIYMYTVYIRNESCCCG